MSIRLFIVQCYTYNIYMIDNMYIVNKLYMPWHVFLGGF